MSKRWSKPTRKKCTKTEEREVLEHLRKIGQYLAWLETLSPTDQIKMNIASALRSKAKWHDRYKELVGR